MTLCNKRSSCRSFTSVPFWELIAFIGISTLLDVADERIIETRKLEAGARGMKAISLESDVTVPGNCPIDTNGPRPRRKAMIKPFLLASGPWTTRIKSFLSAVCSSWGWIKTPNGSFKASGVNQDSSPPSQGIVAKISMARIIAILRSSSP